MTLSERQAKFTTLLGYLIRFAEKQGIIIKIVELNRDLERQKKLVSEGKSATLESLHLQNCAVDLLVLDRDFRPVDIGAVYRPLGEYWEKIGGRWGGRFGVKKEEYGHKIGWDPGHFEYKGDLENG